MPRSMIRAAQYSLLSAIWHAA